MAETPQKSVAGQFLKPKEKKTRVEKVERKQNAQASQGTFRPDLTGPALPPKIQQMLNKRAHGLVKIVTTFYPTNQTSIVYYTDKRPGEALTVEEFLALQRSDLAEIEQKARSAAAKAVLGKIRDRLLIPIPVEISPHDIERITREASYEKLAEGIMGWSQDKYSRFTDHSAKVKFLRTYEAEIRDWMANEPTVAEIEWNPLTKEEKNSKKSDTGTKTQLQTLQAEFAKANAADDFEEAQRILFRLAELTKAARQEHDLEVQEAEKSASATVPGKEKNLPPRPDDKKPSSGKTKKDLDTKSTTSTGSSKSETKKTMTQAAFEATKSIFGGGGKPSLPESSVSLDPPAQADGTENAGGTKE
jgi:hypothetical protein